MLTLVSILFVSVSAIPPAFFVQFYLTTWGYDQFWSAGLAVITISFSLIFLIFFLFLSRLTANLRGSTVSRMMLRHSIIFAPFFLLTIRHFLPKYQNQRIAIQLLAILTAVLSLAVIFMIHEDWTKRVKNLSVRVFAKNALPALVATLAVLTITLKLHEVYLITRFASQVDYVSLQDTTRKIRYAKVPGRFEWKAHVPQDGTFEITLFSNNHYRTAEAASPLHYEISLRPPSGPSVEIAEGKLGDNQISRIRYDVSAFAGKTVSFEFTTKRSSPAFAMLEDIHIALGRLQELWALQGWTPRNIMQAYWSEPLIYARRRPGDTNVLFVVFDTLRADHVGCLGYRWNTTPTVDRLAREGVLFTRAISQAPWTMASFASMYTGRLPSSHLAGSSEKYGFLYPSRFSTQPNFIDFLRERGYYTEAFVTNPYLAYGFGMNQGFDEYHMYSGGAKKASDLANAWLESNAGKKFFLLLHYMEPHRPYIMRKDFDPILKAEAGDTDRNGKPPSRESESAFSNLDRSILAYDTEIAFDDYQLGRVIDKLDELGLRDDTLIVFVSDHGEEFLEHGGKHDHGHTLFDELLHVPLVITFPKGLPRNERINTQVRLFDVFPTILDTLGMEFDEESISGKSLKSLITKETSENRVAISEFLLYGPEEKSIRTEQYKLIYIPSKDQIQLYNVIADPKETRDISAEEPSVCAELMDRLNAELEHSSTQRFGKLEAPVVDEETRKSLKSLGYVQ